MVSSYFRFGKAWHSLRDREEGGHQDHQQGQVDGVGAAEGRAGDRHHEADRAPARPRPLRRLREQEVPVSVEERRFYSLSCYLFYNLVND